MSNDLLLAIPFFHFYGGAVLDTLRLGGRSPRFIRASCSAPVRADMSYAVIFRGCHLGAITRNGCCSVIAMGVISIDADAQVWLFDAPYVA